MLLTSGSKEGGSLWRCGSQILNRAPATFSAGQAARSWASAYHVDRGKGHRLEGDHEGQRLARVPWALAGIYTHCSCHCSPDSAPDPPE